MNKCKNIVKFFICGFAIVGLTACGDGSGNSGNSTDTANPLQTQTLSLDQNSYTATAGGDTIQVSASGEGSGTISYSIANTAIATIDASGEITPLIIGKTTITATITADSIYATATTDAQLTVLTQQNLAFNSNAYNATALSDTIQISASGEGSGTISYSIADTAIATIDASGEITPRTAGQTTITATIAADNIYAATTATVQLIVALQTQTLSFDQSSYSGTAQGDIIQASATGEGTGAISYAIANTAIATIDANTGDITPLTGGPTTISATIAADSIYDTTTATAELIVALGNQTLAFDQNSYTATALGNTIQVSLNSEGSGAISYSIANTDIATIDDNGVITPLTAGKTTVTATIDADSVYDATTATAQLNVLTQRSISLAPATFISLDAANDTAQITIASNGSTDDAIYASANDTIATVSNSGVVTAVAAGEVVITATLPQDNTHSNATATIQVCVSMVDCDSDGLIEINSLSKRGE